MLLFFPLLCLSLSLCCLRPSSQVPSSHLSNPHIVLGICPNLTLLQIPVSSSAWLFLLSVALLGSIHYSVIISFPPSLLHFPSPSSPFPVSSSTSPRLSYCSKSLFVFTYYLEFPPPVHCVSPNLPQSSPRCLVASFFLSGSGVEVRQVAAALPAMPHPQGSQETQTPFLLKSEVPFSEVPPY